MFPWNTRITSKNTFFVLVSSLSHRHLTTLMELVTEWSAQVLTSLGEEVREEEVARMIQQVDADGDGKVDYQEFAAMMAETV